MITISDIESVREELIDIFPDAVRGSVAMSNWGNGKRELHLAYFIMSDTVGGYKVVPDGNLYKFYEWDTNTGIEWAYSHHDQYEFIRWIKKEFEGKKFGIDSCIKF